MFDESRPQINGLPAYGNPAIAVLPRLNITPNRGETVTISVILAIDCLIFSEFKVLVSEERLEGLLQDYRSDPETFLKILFGYESPKKLTMIVKPQIKKVELDISDFL
jgi:hypothetical protein